MDWIKAKSILIIVFLILNTYLITNIAIQIKQDRIPAETIAQAVRILDEKGVLFSAGVNIPSYNKKTPMLVFDSAGANKKTVADVLLGKGKYEIPESGNDSSIEGRDNSRLTQSFTGELAAGSQTLAFLKDMHFVYQNSSPSGNIQIESKKEADRISEALIKSLGLPPSQFVQDSYIKKDDQVETVYIGRYKGFYVYDNYIVIKMTKQGITFIRCRYRKIKGFTEMKREIFPAHLILLKRHASIEEMTIKSIKLGFKGMSSITYEDDEGRVMTESFSPAWRIEYTDGTCSYFTAYDGEEIK